MPKTFYTEHDIEDLAQRGVQSLVVDDNVVLTDLARDKALRLGMQLLREAPPSAPERPYLASLKSPSASSKPVDPPKKDIPPIPATLQPKNEDMYQKVYAASLERLGNSVDPKLLETIIRRVLNTVTAR